MVNRLRRQRGERNGEKRNPEKLPSKSGAAVDIMRDSFWYRKMFLWLVPRNYDIAGTVGIWAVNFIVGGLIGGVVLICRLACAVFYLFKYGYDFATA